MARMPMRLVTPSRAAMARTGMSENTRIATTMTMSRNDVPQRTCRVS